MRISGGQTCALPILAHTVRVLVVGDLLGVGSSTLEHLSVVDSWQEADADVVAWDEQSHAVLDEAGWTRTLAARAVDPAPMALAPLLIRSAKHPPPALVPPPPRPKRVREGKKGSVR